MESRTVRAGDWTARFEACGLRDIRWRGHEVLRGIYAAVRDRNWGTVEPKVVESTIESQPEFWWATFVVRHDQGDIRFTWRGTITIGADGIDFDFDGVAESTFLRNRIGLCVLHPMEAAGERCRAGHSDGTTTEATLPKLISPHQPFLDLTSLAHELMPNIWATVIFEGEVFEMEDQRNWTDASFKTYCTPLALPFPAEVQKGARIRQRIRLKVTGEAEPVKFEGPVSLELGEIVGPRPRMGLEWSPGSSVPIPVDFLRVPAENTSPARKFGLPLEIALSLPSGAEKASIDALEIGPGDRVLLYHQAAKTTPPEWIEAFRRRHPTAALFAGTDHFFAELNRGTPPLDHIDGLTFSINPQVHAFDDRSVMETLVAQAAVVESARALSGGKPVVVSPITMKMRSNPNATDGSALTTKDRLDPRLGTAFGAAWTLGSLKRMGESGALAATYFETAGPLGIQKTPIVDVLRRYLAPPDAVVRRVVSSDPYRVDGWALESYGHQYIGIANLTAERQTVCFDGKEKDLRPWEIVYV